MNNFRYKKLQITSCALQVVKPPRPSGTPPFKRRGILLFYLSAFLLFCFLLTGCTEVKREYYDNGKLKSETHYRFGKETGTTTYYSLGYPTKTMEIEMKRGKRNGNFIERYFNNTLKVVAFYVDDLVEGKETHFYMSGNRSMEINYTKGIKNGPVTSWYDNGLIKESGFYVNDLFDGDWENYDERGLLIGEGSFKQGTGLQIIYDEMGRLLRETHLVNNKKDGLETHYFPSGEIAKTIFFKEDRMIKINGVPVDSL